MKKLIPIIAAACLTAFLCGCVNMRPVISGDEADRYAGAAEHTPVPTESGPAPVSETETAAPSSTHSPEKTTDALGNLISGSDHFQRYITFKTILVYEEDQDTFFDGIAQNDYPYPITCAVDVVYRDESGGEIARSRLQTRDGNYLLVLQPGETVILAHIFTDITLTEMPYELEYDMEVGVKPIE